MNDRLKAVDGLHIKQSEIDGNLENIWKYLTIKPWHDKYEYMKDFIITTKADFDGEAAQSFYERNL